MADLCDMHELCERAVMKYRNIYLGQPALAHACPATVAAWLTGAWFRTLLSSRTADYCWLAAKRRLLRLHGRHCLDFERADSMVWRLHVEVLSACQWAVTGSASGAMRMQTLRQLVYTALMPDLVAMLHNVIYMCGQKRLCSRMRTREGLQAGCRPRSVMLFVSDGYGDQAKLFGLVS